MTHRADKAHACDHTSTTINNWVNLFLGHSVIVKEAIVEERPLLRKLQPTAYFVHFVSTG